MYIGLKEKDAISNLIVLFKIKMQLPIMQKMWNLMRKWLLRKIKKIPNFAYYQNAFLIFSIMKLYFLIAFFNLNFKFLTFMKFYFLFAFKLNNQMQNRDFATSAFVSTIKVFLL